METKEWKFGWTDDTPGPWQAEPDKMQWEDPETKLPCLILRNKHSGHLCGYVGVSKGHPYFEKTYSGGWEDHTDPESRLDVHGGLTFSEFCADNQEEGICHVPGEGEDDHVWWFGFDCAHHMDRSFFLAKDLPKSTMDIFATGVYRDLEYVRQECTSLAKQLKDIT